VADKASPATPAAAEVAQEETTLGLVQCHCSEPDGVPDVGVSIGLGGGYALWIGELLNRDGANCGLILHGPDRIRETVPLPDDTDWSPIGDMLRDHIGPLLARHRLAVEQAARAGGDALDGNDIWEALFGILKGDVPDALTEDVCQQLADAIARSAAPHEAGRENDLPRCRICGAPAGLDCRTAQGRIPPCHGRESTAPKEAGERQCQCGCNDDPFICIEADGSDRTSAPTAPAGDGLGVRWSYSSATPEYDGGLMPAGYRCCIVQMTGNDCTDILCRTDRHPTADAAYDHAKRIIAALAPDRPARDGEVS